MRFSILVVAAIFLTAAPASAGPWVAAMEEDEGGPVLAASVYPDGGELAPSMRIMCFEAVNVRYDPGTGAEGGANPLNAKIAFEFVSGTLKVSREMAYEDMDGMFAANVPPADPLIGLLTGGGSVTITDPTGMFSPQTLTLEGSSAAIGQVLADCS